MESMKNDSPHNSVHPKANSQTLYDPKIKAENDEENNLLKLLFKKQFSMMLFAKI
jgi:hypothetical protein